MPGFGLTDDVYDATPVVGGKPLFKRTVFGYTLIDMHGKSKAYTVSIEGHEGFDRGEAETLAERIAEASNAGLVSWYCKEERWINESDAFTYDEGYSSVEQRLVLVFQSSKAFGDTLPINVPAPDASVIENGAVDLSNTLIDNILDAFAALAGAGDYSLQTAYVWDGSDRRHEAPAQGLDIQEPGLLDSPGPGPGEVLP